MLDLNLLRSPQFPFPGCDEGCHEFIYSFLPHPGGLTASDVMAEAARLNRPPLRFDGLDADGMRLPVQLLEGDGIVVGAVKKAEKCDSLVLRLVETCGNLSHGAIAATGTELVETDLMEERRFGATPLVEGRAEIVLKPFEIRTYLLK